MPDLVICKFDEDLIKNVICKFDEDSIKNVVAIVHTTFSPLYV